MQLVYFVWINAESSAVMEIVDKMWKICSCIVQNYAREEDLFGQHHIIRYFDSVRPNSLTDASNNWKFLNLKFKPTKQTKNIGRNMSMASSGILPLPFILTHTWINFFFFEMHANMSEQTSDRNQLSLHNNCGQWMVVCSKSILEPYWTLCQRRKHEASALHTD